MSVLKLERIVGSNSILSVIAISDSERSRSHLVIGSGSSVAPPRPGHAVSLAEPTMTSPQSLAGRSSYREIKLLSPSSMILAVFGFSRMMSLR